MPNAPARTVDQALKNIRLLHQAGVRSLKEHPQPLRLPQPVTTDGERLYKAREFARLYDHRKLRELLELWRKACFAPGYGHIARLLSVKAPALRVGLQKRMARGHWSVRQLSVEILKRQGYRKAGAGRRERPSADLAEDLCRLGQMVHRWRRLHEQIRRRLEEGQVTRSEAAGATRLPRRLEAVEKAMRQVLALANGRLKPEAATTRQGPAKALKSKAGAGCPSLVGRKTGGRL